MRFTWSAGSTGAVCNRPQSVDAGGDSKRAQIKAMNAESGADSSVAGQRCDSCGARVAEMVTACPFCGARRLNLVSLEEETRVFLEALEVRLLAALSDQPDGLIAPSLFIFVVAGPACYLLLDSHTDLGILARIGLAVLASFVALVMFGRALSLRDDRAQAQVWRELVSPAVRRYIERKGFSDAEFLSQVSRLLGEASQLRKMLLLRL